MNIKELIEKYEYLNHSYFRRVDTSEVLKDLRQLDKPQKVKVPQFVADWYEEHKDNLEYNIWDWMKYNLEPKKRENVIFSQWLGKTVNNPVETLIKMKLFGYEVEKEKQYLVKFKGLNRRYIILKYDKYDKTWFLGGELEFNFHRTHHTRKELEEAGFGEVFNSTLFEVEEVEEVE